MIYVTPFEADHFWRVKLQAAQAHFRDLVTPEGVKSLEGTHACTLMDDGKPLVCAGAFEHWPGRALVWSFLSDDVTPKNFRSVHAEGRRWLAALPFRRLEADVDVGFANGHRWMRALGFTVEAPLRRQYQPDGGDAVGYVRLKG